MRRLLVSLLAGVLMIGVGVVLGTLLNPLGGAAQPPPRQIVTVEVLVTATPDPNATVPVRIITATPLPGSIGALPTGVLESTDGPTRNAPTLDPELLGASAALQETATALPQNCILHTVAAGDTPFGIAEIYGSNGFELMAVNGLTEQSATGLQIGDVLIVPLEGCALTAADLNPPTATATAAAAAEQTAEATDESTEEAQPTVRPTLTLPPTAVNAQVEIVRIISAGDITAEGVEIRNLGGVVDMTGWTLSDGGENTFTFPEQRLFTNGMVTVFTRVGQNTPIALYWGRSSAVWDDGEIITLSNRSGVVQASQRLEAPVNLP